MTVITEKHHAKISPSGSKRWMTCPGSVRLIDSLNLPRKASRFAAEGTVAHEVHDLCLSNKLEAKYYIGKIFTADGFKFKVTEEMSEAVQESLDYISERVENAEYHGLRVEVKTEIWCSLSELDIPGLEGGTSDVVLLFWDDSGKEPVLNEVEIVDYKHGQGVSVEAEHNTQALHYALGVILLPELNGHGLPNGISITISQPRAFHPEGPIRTWTVDKEYILNWMDDELIPKAKRTQDEDAEFVAGEEGCRFCDGAPHCPKLLEKTQEIAMLDFTNSVETTILPSVETLTVEQKCSVMDHIPMIRAFLVAVEDQIKQEVDHGSQEYVGKYKLVKGQTRRKFLDDATDELVSPLFDYLENSDIFEEKPRSMTEIERRLKKKVGAKEAKEIMSEVTITPEAKLVIAPESDRRKAVQPSIVGDFKDLD